MPMTIEQNMLLLNVPFLIFVLCFLALVMTSLFKLAKIFKFTYCHTVLKDALEDLKFFHLLPVSVMLWRMEIGYFSNFPIKHLKFIKANTLNIFSNHYFKAFLISFLLFCFYYTVMKFIVMLFSTSIYTFFLEVFFLTIYLS